MNHLDLETLHLDSGGHDSFEQGHCVMEAVAYFAHEPHSDRPQCASRVVTSFLQSWNDSLADEPRQRLKRFIPLVVGTRTTAADETKRAWLAADWLVRTFTPVWLDKAGLADHAARLRALNALTSSARARKAQPIIDDARKAASAARDAAGVAARDAARAAAGAAAWAAGDAAWAAGDAAGVAAGVAAWAAAWAAARAAAGDAAGVAAKKKGFTAQYEAARQAVDAVLTGALSETISQLQASAEDLLERMIAVGRQ